MSYSEPAPIANRSIVRLQEGRVRIAFSEDTPRTNTPNFRSAVTQGIRDAQELQNNLSEILRKYRDSISGRSGM